LKFDKLKYKSISYFFVVCIIGVALTFLIFPKEEISKAERRSFAQLPEFTLENIKNESFMEDLEKYFLDHFPFRQQLRRIKAGFSYEILKQKENNGIYVADDHASKLEYPLNETSVVRFSDKLMNLRKRYFPNQNVYYSVIPDKNYFLAEKEGYPLIDYVKLTDILNTKLSDFEYIDIFPTLEIHDYYNTDTHWRQEKLLDTVDVIMKGMNADKSYNFDIYDFKINEINDFYGVYYGQSALALEPDTIIFLTNNAIDNALAWNFETNEIKPVYELDELNNPKSVDMYDIFLGGATPLQVIENKELKDNSHLIIFRDSYTSSLAPLLINGYAKITLIDLRYISSELLGEYVDFENADVLFLYNTLIINNSTMLK